jgi:triacylglycerol lipase
MTRILCLSLLWIACSQDAGAPAGGHPLPPMNGLSPLTPLEPKLPNAPMPGMWQPPAQNPPSQNPPQPPADDPAGPPYPVVLMHGMFGFQKIELLGLDYFNGIVADLATHGERQVFATHVPMLASSADRATAIQPFIDQVLAQTGKRKVNLIGHSQGGLDARYLVSSMGYGDRVASVTMIATPNHGSRVADAILALAPGATYPLLEPLLDLYGIIAGDSTSQKDLQTSLVWLSESYVDEVFNPANPDDPRVLYFSWAGRSNLAAGGADCEGGMLPDDNSKLDLVDPLFLATGGFLSTEGLPDHPVNDGLVSVNSAKHGTFMGCVPADHLDEVGQLAESGADLITGFDHLAFFRMVVGNLRDNGL